MQVTLSVRWGFGKRRRRFRWSHFVRQFEGRGGTSGAEVEKTTLGNKRL